MTISRRSVVRTAAWTAPAIVVATAAPAYATSAETSCTVVGNRYPGEGFHGGKIANDKDFFVSVFCGDAVVATTVTIGGVAAVLTDRGWHANLGNSGRNQIVEVFSREGKVFSNTIDFPLAETPPHR